MKVLLLKNVLKVGKKDDVIEVSQGYATNALFPQKLAVIATDANIAAVKIRAQHKVAEKEIQHNLLDRAIGELQGKALVYTVKVNEKGSLFSKIDVQDISNELLKQYRVSIDPSLMTLETNQIKQAGLYSVCVQDGKYQSTFSLEIKGE